MKSRQKVFVPANLLNPVNMVCFACSAMLDLLSNLIMASSKIDVQGQLMLFLKEVR